MGRCGRAALSPPASPCMTSSENSAADLKRCAQRAGGCHEQKQDKSDAGTGRDRAVWPCPVLGVGGRAGVETGPGGRAENRRG
jgi:hypothetical protein